MQLNPIDTSKCRREEKEVVEGICLSYDMIRGICLETMNGCEALPENPEIQEI